MRPLLVADADKYYESKTTQGSKLRAVRSRTLNPLLTSAATMIEACTEQREKAPVEMEGEFRAAAEAVVAQLATLPVKDTRLVNAGRVAVALDAYKRGQVPTPTTDEEDTIGDEEGESAGTRDGAEAKPAIIQRALTYHDVTRMQLIQIRVEALVSAAIQEKAEVDSFCDLLTLYVAILDSLSQAHEDMKLASEQRTAPNLGPILKQVGDLRSAWLSYSNQ